VQEAIASAVKWTDRSTPSVKMTWCLA